MDSNICIWNMKFGSRQEDKSVDYHSAAPSSHPITNLYRRYHVLIKVLIFIVYYIVGTAFFSQNEVRPFSMSNFAFIINFNHLCSLIRVGQSLSVCISSQFPVPLWGLDSFTQLMKRREDSISYTSSLGSHSFSEIVLNSLVPCCWTRKTNWSVEWRLGEACVQCRTCLSSEVAWFSRWDSSSSHYSWGHCSAAAMRAGPLSTPCIGVVRISCPIKLSVTTIHSPARQHDSFAMSHSTHCPSF